MTMSLPFSGHLSGSARAGEKQSFLYIKASANEHTLDSKKHAMLLELQHRFKMKMLILRGGEEAVRIGLSRSRSENGGARWGHRCGYGRAWADKEEGTTLNPVMNKTSGGRCGTTSRSRGGGGKRRRWGGAFYRMRRGGGAPHTGRPGGGGSM
jgi:hypothetical protein